MCYNVVSGTRTQIKYAKHRGDDPAYIAELERKLKHYEKEFPKYYTVSGFSHPKLLVFTNQQPDEPQGFIWGLIPIWVKDVKGAATIQNQTLNARSETIFEKPSFRTSAKNKRCLIFVDAFYEHYHFKGKTYPFHISMKDNEPMTLAGLWEEWVDKGTGEVKKTVTIVTTKANLTMSKIHNNPKAEEPRMPVILPKERQDDWLVMDGESILELTKPFADELLEYYPVGKILGKEAIGNVPEAEEKVEYHEIENILQ